MSPTTVVLADDHPVVVRDAGGLETQPNMAVVGEADEGAAAIRLFEQLQPDVLILDLAMPGLGRLDVSCRCIGECPNTHHPLDVCDEAYVVQALRMARWATFLKGAPRPSWFARP